MADNNRYDDDHLGQYDGHARVEPLQATKNPDVRKEQVDDYSGNNGRYACESCKNWLEKTSQPIVIKAQEQADGKGNQEGDKSGCRANP